MTVAQPARRRRPFPWTVLSAVLVSAAVSNLLRLNTDASVLLTGLVGLAVGLPVAVGVGWLEGRRHARRQASLGEVDEPAGPEDASAAGR